MNLSIDCDGRPAEVEIEGSGPNVVFVGTAAPMAWTRSAAHDLALQGFRVTNFDYGSGADDPVERTAISQADDVLTVMDHLEIGAATLVGLSRGAMTAFAVAATQPGRVESLVLAFPVAGFQDTMMIVHPDPTPEDGEESDDFMRRMLETIYSSEFLKSHSDQALSVVMTSPGSVVRVDRSREETFPGDWSVSHPTLVVEGGADQIVLPPHPKRYIEAIPRSQHVAVPHASHGWLMEQPATFAEMVAGFLSAI